MVISKKQEVTHPLVSVVVPVHHMSGKLHTLKSWVRETPPCVEIILLHDDHDFDDATNMELMRIVNKSQNYFLFRKNWGNPGDARNFGKEIARGVWIVFADSDDYLHINEIVNYLRGLEQDKVDLIIGQFETIRGISSSFEKTKKVEDLLKNLGNWRIVYKKTYITNSAFPPLRMGEDQVFFCQVLRSKPQMKICNKIFYSYHSAIQGQLTSKPLYEDLAIAISMMEDIFLSSESNKRLLKGLLVNQSLSMFINRPTLRNGCKLLNIETLQFNLIPYSILITTKLFSHIVKRNITK